jgi:hypothetical protein
MTRDDWRADARCANLGMKDKAVLDLFYPDVGSNKTARFSAMLHRRAKRVCAKCPVRKPCLEDALSHEEGRTDPATGIWTRKLAYGVWGGHTPQDRHMRNIRHYPECVCKRPYPGCRPISERVELLEELFMGEIARHLTPDERKAG